MLVLIVTTIILVGSFNHHNVFALDSTSTTVTAGSSAVNSWTQTVFTAIIKDTSNSTLAPTGSVTWTDNNSGGTFNPSFCTLPSGGCTTSYTPATNSPSSVTITASYGGDVNRTASNGTLQLTVNHFHPTSTKVMPNSATVNSGTSISYTATVADTSTLITTPTGNVTWTDNNSGGTFNPSFCTLPSGGCTTSYTPATNSPSSVTITASYGGDSSHSGSAGVSTLMVNVLHRTTATIKPNPAILSANGTAKFVILVNDSSSSPTVPIGTVSWSDGNSGGIFNVTSCTLSSGTCAALYTASGNPPNVITINATYSGDNTHSSTSTVSILSTNVSYTTTTKVTPNPATLVAGNPVVFTANVVDTSNPSASLIGLVSWSDNGAGGTFNQNGCALSENHCSLTYTPPSNPSNTITIVASYAGDSAHSGSSGTSSLLVTGSTQTSQSISTSNQSTNNVVIPQWIRSNAKFWHDNSIGDSDFEKGIQYLIQKGIMKIPPTQSGTNNGTNQQIPSWVKNNAGWWASGQISDDEFVKGIQYLIQQGIIIV